MIFFRKPHVFITLLCLILFSQVVSRGAEDNFHQVRHVLLLNSYHERMTWVENIVKSVEEVLQPDKNNLSLHIENMDSKLFFSPEYFAIFRDYLRVKYQDIDFSLILSSDNNGYDFLRTHRDTLFPDVPVSFCGVNDFEQSQLIGLEHFTGAAEIFSARQTADIALKIHPKTTEIFIINDYLKTGRAWARDIDLKLKGISPKVRIRHSDNLSFAKLQEEISNLSSTTVVLLGVYFADRDGLYFTYEKIGALISEVSQVPVYCLLEFNIGQGVVGGRVISGAYQGKAMAEIGMAILDGEEVESLPVRIEGNNRYVFDYIQLERFGIDESLLPPDSLILNRPYSFYQEHKSQVWMVICFIITLLATICRLIVNIQQRKHAEIALQGSEKRFRQLANATWEAIVVHDDGIFFHGNDPFYSLFGYKPDELHGRHILPLIIQSEQIGEVSRRVQNNILEPYESVGLNASGQAFPIEIRVREMEYEGRDVRMAAIRDLSGRKHMEQRMAQSQKLEAMGTLAGGIAHDFNNILSAIIGYCELSLMSCEKNTKISENLGEILMAGNRAKELVQQILTFARKSDAEKAPIQVSLVVLEVLKLLRASFPASIEIEKRINSNAAVLADTTKIHQILMNLCTNGAKAMKDGGVLTVTLDAVDLDQNFVSQHFGVVTGQYLQLTVADTGVGIPPEIKNKIFDPFFTTQKKGEGTGLGLSVVHGIVQDCKGLTTVDSEPGKGCEFNVYLPIIDAANSNSTNITELLPVGNERILLVDDEQILVNMMSEVLTNLGYEVSGFINSIDALHVFSKNPDRFDLVITDMTMPLMTGENLAAEMLKIRPDLPIILSTGYTEQITEAEVLQKGIKSFVMKPVVMSTLAKTIREVLS